MLQALGFMDRSRLPHLSVHELVFYLLALVQELGRRFPWTVRDTPAPPDFPPPGGTDQEAPEDPVACTGKCIVCRSACIRLQPGHKHCKCRAHLHWR